MGFFVLLAACGILLPARALDISNRYRSPRNPERRIRPATRLIVLHTTEAHARSSLNKLSERGEAHYCVTEDGSVYRIIDRDRVAFHAGRSMWNGREDCDDYALGIEVVGYHNKPMPLKQLNALKALVGDLKKIYGLTDVQVVCHSHVAYGAPNRWHKCRHRGRKRCGMLFAMWSVRTRLGLKTRPAADPDVRAGRLVQKDKYLEGVLYGKTDTMAAHYARGGDPGASSGGLFAGLGNLFSFGGTKPTPKTPSVKPTPAPKTPAKKGAPPAKPAAAKSATPTTATIAPGAFKNGAKKITPGTAPGTTGAPAVAGAPAVGDWYLLPDGRYFQDDRLPKSVKLPPGTRRLIGYRLSAPLAPGASAYGLIGAAWRAPTTYYIFGGKIKTGDKVEAREIPAGARIFYKK